MSWLDRILAVKRPVSPPGEQHNLVPILSKDSTPPDDMHKLSSLVPDSFRFDEGFSNLSSLISYLVAQDPTLESRNAFFKMMAVSPQEKQRLDTLLQHITDKMGPIETASMGEEAIVLNFKGSNHILRLTPKRRMLDTVLNNQLVIDQVVRHHSICVGENNDIVLSVVPRLSVRIHDYTHLESVFNIIRNKYFDYQRGGVIFSDIKPENLGELPDGTPLVTDLGAIRKFKPTEAFEQMERQLDSYLDILNPGRKTASDLEWYIPTEAGPMHKQHFYFGDPAQSKLGHALSAAIEKMKEERLGYKPSLAV